MTDVPFQITGSARIWFLPIHFQATGILNFPAAGPSKAGAWITVRCDGLTLTAKGDQMAYTLPSGMKVGLQVAYVDANGNPAKVDGDPRWEESDKNIILLQVDPQNAFQATLHTVGPLGQAQVKVGADADLGEGVKPIISLLDVEVVAGEAVAGVITPVGAPETVSAAAATTRRK